MSPTCDGGVAAGTLFGIHAAETLDTVRTLSLRGEGLASQRSFAAGAEKTVFVPHLVLVGHPSFSQSLQDAKTHNVVRYVYGLPTRCCKNKTQKTLQKFKNKISNL